MAKNADFKPIIYYISETTEDKDTVRVTLNDHNTPSYSIKLFLELAVWK